MSTPPLGFAHRVRRVRAGVDGGRWYDAITPRAFALLVGFALASAALYQLLGGYGSQRPFIRRHLFLTGWAEFGYALSMELWTVIAMALAVAWVVHRLPRHGIPQYASTLGAIAIVGAIRMVLQYAQGTSYSFRLEHILPEGTFDFLKIDFTKDPQAHDILYSVWNRLSIVFGLWLEPFAYGSAFASAYLYVRAQSESAKALAQSTVDAEATQREIVAARLQMLEAQIEPHFLFNTLANVRRLYETDRATGGRMLDNLMRYLAEALPHMRDADASLGRELALTEAYLEVQQIRMGRRLRFVIDVPGALRGARMPPMMLLTLVENAIKHGLNPLPEGGTLRIAAQRVGDRLLAEVRDTGRGFRQASGAGSGLANIRARLALTYGPDASLRLQLNDPSGVVASLDLPYEPVTKAGESS